MEAAIQALMEAKTIALVGLDAREDREAYRIALFLRSKGYRVIPVPVQRPADAVLGEKAYTSVRDIPEKVDLVDVFVRSEYTGPIIDDAIAAGAGAVWLQLGIRNDDGIARARAAGLAATQDLCTAVEYQRVRGEWQEKQRLLEKLASERKLLVDAFSALDSAGWGFRRTEEEWSARQQLLHLAGAESELLAAARRVAGVEGGALAAQRRPAPPFDEAERWSPDAIFASLAAVRAETNAFVSALPDDRFECEAEHPSYGRIRVIQLLRAVYGHDQQHTGQLHREGTGRQ